MTKMSAQHGRKEAFARKSPTPYSVQSYDDERNNMLPPITSLAKDTDFGRAEPPNQGALTPKRASYPFSGDSDPSLDDKSRIRRPPSASELRNAPPIHQQQHLPPLSQRSQKDYEYSGDAPHPRHAGDSYNFPQQSRSVGPSSLAPIYSRGQERFSPTDESRWARGPSPSYDRAMQDAQGRPFTAGSYPPRSQPDPYPSRGDEASQAWSRPGDEYAPLRGPPPPTAHGAYRDDPSWHAPPGSRERPNLQIDPYSRDRARMEEERWAQDRARRAEQAGPPAPGYPQSSPHAPEPRSLIRPLDTEAEEEMRRLRRRGTYGDAGEDVSPPGYFAPPNRPHAMGTYSPPDARMYGPGPSNAGMRPGLLGPMDPPRPASTLGVMPVRGATTSTNAPASAPAAPGTNTVNANRRVAHLLSEQKRRESINTGFEDLRQAIPACRDGQDSKATILRRALEYIRELENIVERTHRAPVEGHHMAFDTRSPPDDQDDMRRLGRPGDDGRRDSGPGRRGPSSGGGEADTGPRIGGLPSNSFGNGQRVEAPFRRQGPSNYRFTQMTPSPLASWQGPPHADQQRYSPPSPFKETQMVSPHNVVRAKRWSEDEVDGRAYAKRRLSDGDQQDLQSHSPHSNHYVTHSVHESESSKREGTPPSHKPRDWTSNLESERLDNKSLVEPHARSPIRKA